MKYIVFGCPHIEEAGMFELEHVFTEIFSLAKKDDVFICLGDWYDTKRPLAIELDFGTYWARKFSAAHIFWMIEGNHPYISEDVSSIKYLRQVGIQIYKEKFFDKMYFTHKMTEKSDMHFGMGVPCDPKWFVETKDLKGYHISVLGHQHKFQKVTSKIFHPGSCRFTNFSEVNDGGKFVGIIKKTPKKKTNKISFVELKSVIPMKDISDIEELRNTDAITKVRYVFRSFEQVKMEIDAINKLKPKFYQFKIKYDFKSDSSKEDEVKPAYQETNRRKIIQGWLNTIKDEDTKTILNNEFKEYLSKQV